VDPNGYYGSIEALNHHSLTTSTYRVGYARRDASDREKRGRLLAGRLEVRRRSAAHSLFTLSIEDEDGSFVWRQIIILYLLSRRVRVSGW
jgi:hypothetical protein